MASSWYLYMRLCFSLTCESCPSVDASFDERLDRRSWNTFDLHRHLIILAVLPGNREEIWTHWFPYSACAAIRIESSSEVHSPVDKFGSRVLSQRSLQSFAGRPTSEATADHIDGCSPEAMESISVVSSTAVQNRFLIEESAISIFLVARVGSSRKAWKPRRKGKTLVRALKVFVPPAATPRGSHRIHVSSFPLTSLFLLIL
mmetsp:Transcript_13875/g.28414  ORF Transcript_13875/g.28414 Transcript_13875/m.28414 type:complete len:202 (+) Transcript_13875:838-1443(+)